MSDVTNLIDSLRYRPVATTAAQMREAADELERLRAQVARLTAENDWLRAYTAQSAKACIYCGLGADEQGECNRGFPGCARADDQMLCREVEVAMERDELRAEVARLTAEQDAVSAAIGTNEYMDPPDGGNVSLAEQVRRMRDALLACVEATEKDATRYRWLRGDAPPYSLRWMRWEVRYWNGEYWDDLRTDKLNAALDAAIDAAMEGVK